MSPTVQIALSKGRILEESLPLLARAGIAPTEDPASSRKLVFDTHDDNVKLIVIRAADVPTYVQYGAADLGYHHVNVVARQRVDPALYLVGDVRDDRGRTGTTSSCG